MNASFLARLYGACSLSLSYSPLQVRNYFNTKGFDRWKRIYGEADDINSVQKDIREGHAVTVEKVSGLGGQELLS